MDRLVLFVFLFFFGGRVCLAQEVEQEVTIYADNSYPPYAFHIDGIAQGIYVDILQSMANQMAGYRVKIVPVPWKRGLDLVKSGKGFALIPPYFRPKERPYISPYSVSILDEHLSLYCNQKKVPKESASDREWPSGYYGFTIGRNRGFLSGGADYLDAIEMGKIIDSEANSSHENIKRLVKLRIDCYVNDDASIRWYLHKMMKSNELDREQVGDVYKAYNISSENGYIGYSNQNDESFPFKDDFIKKSNLVLERMKEKGEIDSIYNSYIKSD